MNETFEDYYRRTRKRGTKVDRNLLIAIQREFYSLRTLGFMHGLSAERIRQICRKIDKIYKAWKEKHNA